MKKCIIIANGKAPSKRLTVFLASKGYNKIICADGGANSARKLSVIPDFIIGDLDSISPENLDFFTGKSEIIKLPRQSDTDVEKCLKYAISKKFTDVVLLGVIGDRLDHSFGNLSIALKFSDRLNIRIVSGQTVLDIVSEEIELNTYPGETISLYGFDRKTLLTSDGLLYPLNKTPLPFGEKEGTSNVAVSSKVSLKVKGGSIFIVRQLNTLRKHDLF